MEASSSSLHAVGSPHSERGEPLLAAALFADAFGIGANGVVAAMAAACSRISLRAGEILFAEGDEADAVHVVETGRLRAYRQGTLVGEIGPHGLAGEGALIDLAPRGATVAAVRDTVLLRLGLDDYRNALDQEPRVEVALARVALDRLRGEGPSIARRSTFTLVPVSPSLDARRFADQWAACYGPTARVLTSGVVDAELEVPGIAQDEDDAAVTSFLAMLERGQGSIVHVADPDAWSGWSRRVLRTADRIVLLADATTPPAPGLYEQEMWSLLPSRYRPEVSLVLLHPADTKLPSGTPAWLEPRALTSHHHVRRGDQATLSRTARLLEGSGTTVVFGGGGARGFAHIGVSQVFEDLGQPIDATCGSSFGALMAWGLASGSSSKECAELAATAFDRILDYTVPVSSLLGARRITKRMHEWVGDSDLSDLWLPYFCLSTNLTKGRPEVHDRGASMHALRASVSIPGVLPPVPQGEDLLVDGGVLDNVPVSEARRRNPSGTVVAVDVTPGTGPTASTDYGLAVGGLRAFLLRRQGAGPPRLLTTLVRATTVGSSIARERVLTEELADLYVDLDFPGTGMLNFAASKGLSEQAASWARPALTAWVAGEATDRRLLISPDHRERQRSGPPPGKTPRGVLMLTLRDLQYRGSRFVAAIIGTAVVFTMLFLMTGLTEQFHREPRVTVDSFGASGWVLRDGATGPFTSAATIPEGVARRIPGGVGVPLVVGRHSITRDGEHTDVVVIGYRPGALGQPSVVDGRLPENLEEAVVDESAGIAVGETATLGTSTYKVVGHTRDTTLLAGMPLVQVQDRAAQQLLYRGGKFASAVLVPGAVTPPEGYTVLSNDQVAEDVMRPLEGAVSSVNLIRVLLWFVAAMIIGTLVYLSAVDRRRDVAVLKAVGGGTVPLGASIALQGVFVALLAVAAAAGLQALIAPVFPLKIVVPGSAFLQVPLIAVAVALLAGIAGLRKAVGTDPALAFSGADR